MLLQFKLDWFVRGPVWNRVRTPDEVSPLVVLVLLLMMLALLFSDRLKDSASTSICVDGWGWHALFWLVRHCLLYYAHPVWNSSCRFNHPRYCFSRHHIHLWMPSWCCIMPCLRQLGVRMVVAHRTMIIDVGLVTVFSSFLHHFLRCLSLKTFYEPTPRFTTSAFAASAVELLFMLLA